MRVNIIYTTYSLRLLFLSNLIKQDPLLPGGMNYKRVDSIFFPRSDKMSEHFLMRQTVFIFAESE